MGSSLTYNTTMKFLVVLSVAIAAAQCGVILPYAGLGYGHGLGYGLHAVPSVAKSTIKYKTAAFEPVDVATPADAGLGYTGLGHAGVGYAGLGYAGLGYGHGLGFGYGLPLVAAAPAAVAEE